MEPDDKKVEKEMNKIEEYYNKFNEEKRLNSRHGQIEYRITMKYIHDYLDVRMQELKVTNREDIRILDIGAGTGRYSVALCEEGYDVTAVELVKHNLGILKQKNSNVHAMQGNALHLKKLEDNTYDLTLLFGPMYHLMTKEEKIQALSEAKRVTKPGGIILVAYVMNEYAVVVYGIQENHIEESVKNGTLDASYHTVPAADSLYAFERIEDIDGYNEADILLRLSRQRHGGVCSPKDIETMLQLLYLNFTQPRFNKDDVDNLTKMLLAQLANAKSNPDFLMQEKVADVTYGHNPRRQMISTEIVNKFDFEQLPGIYAKLYPGANGFVFTFVGNIDPETLKPLVEKYIGSIPAARKPINYVDDKAYPVKGEVTEEFTAPMQQPKVSVNYHFSGEMPYTLKNKMALTFLTQALNSRYLVSIREEKGGTYGVRVQGSTKYIPRETYSMTISFDTNEEMADELREIVMKEIEEIAANGPKSEDIEKHREFMLKSWKNSLEQNGAWMNYIQIKYGSGLNYIADHEQAIRDLTNADVQALAKKILADGNLVKVVMRPSK